EECCRGGDGALADSTLAGEEDEPVFEEVHATGAGPTGRRVHRRRRQAPNPTRFAPLLVSISTYATRSAGTPTRRPLESVSHSTPSSFFSAASTALVTSSAPSPSSSIVSSLGVCSTPIRTSTVTDPTRGLGDGCPRRRARIRL